jgi:YidC/Oxa1 family membrane protein insertase
MAEMVTGGPGSPNPPKKELSMEVRLLLAFLLMGAVMFLTPYLYKGQAPAPAKKAPQTSAAPAAQKEPASAAAIAAPAPGKKSGKTPEAVVPTTPQRSQPPFVIDTGLLRVSFSNQGATARSIVLNRYKGNDAKPLELLNATGGSFPFSLSFPGDKPAADVNWAWYEQTADPDGMGVTYRYTDGHTAVRKVFRFEKNSYVSRITTEVTLDGKPLRHLIQWRGGFGDLTIPNATANQRALHFDVAQNKLIEQNVGAAKNGPVGASGNFSFAGIADNYFAAVFLPEGSTSVNLTVYTDTVRTPLQEKPEMLTGVALGDGDINRFQLFMGPKDLDLLSKIDPKLVQVVDFGWLSVMAKPLFLLVNWFNEGFVHNFGWSIVLVTIAINMVLFPLKLSSMKSMRKMQALKPQIDGINEKYRNLKMTDPRKADQNTEVMALYKQYGVNPMGGCVPMLLQIPFFFAFYKVFTVSVEMRGASWLWVTDLSQPEHLAIKILPIVMIASQFYMQRMTPQPNADPNQQKMMMFMPLVFGFMFYNFPSGLVLYYLTSNLVSMGQQWFFNHTESAQEAARSVEVPKKKNGRK